MTHESAPSQLPDDFTELPLETALRVLLRAHWRDIEAMQALEAKHGALVRYIDEVRGE